jgi:hypothetical protein
MGNLVEEVKQWNTPIIGSYLLWRFTGSFKSNHPAGDSPVGILHFFALAILTDDELLKGINNKRTDLQSYIRSFEDKKNTDILLNVQKRILDKKDFTLASIDIAVANGLIAWDFESGKIHPIELAQKPSRGKNVKTDMIKVGDKAEILGKWFSRLEINAIASYFKVVL